jgi:hypothetical protein
MIDEFPAISRPDSFFNFCEEPVVVTGQLADQYLHCLKDERFRFTALLRREAVQLTFEFGRELNFHMLESKSENRRCRTTLSPNEFTSPGLGIPTNALTPFLGKEKRPETPVARPRTLFSKQNKPLTPPAK